uniref:Non-structural maintenance of chromosomes element 4 n=1 Tax=Angiostrongylus cantonensis TaxID=6313 RepID=A0A0K0DK99_ANGCA
MPRPLRNSNRTYEDENQDEEDVAQENGLTRKQIEEANYLNSIVNNAEPSEYFAKRASLREAYQDICSQFEGVPEVDKEDSSVVIENLKKSLDDVDRSFQNIGAGGKELAADADTLLSMAKTLKAQMQSLQNANAERVILHMTAQPQCRAPCTLGDDNPLLIEDTEIDGTGSLAEAYEAPNNPDQPGKASVPPKISLDQWAWFSRQNYGTLTYDVSFNYQSLRPVVSNDHEAASQVVSRKEQIKRKKDAKEEAVVLTNKQLGCIDDELSVAQELDKVRKGLKRAWEKNPSSDFYSFVVDPTDFGKTVMQGSFES